MAIKVIYRGRKYALAPNKKYDWVVETHWGSNRLQKVVEKNKTAKSIVKELKATQKRTRVELDFKVNQMPVKRKLNKVM